MRTLLSFSRVRHNVLALDKRSFTDNVHILISEYTLLQQFLGAGLFFFFLTLYSRAPEKYFRVFLRDPNDYRSFIGVECEAKS